MGDPQPLLFHDDVAADRRRGDGRAVRECRPQDFEPRGGWSRMAWLITACLSGCSFALVTPLPSHHEQLPYFDCTESRIAPVIDTIYSATQGIAMVGVAVESDQQYAEQSRTAPGFPRAAVLAVYAVTSVIGAWSAYYGFTRTHKCRDAKASANTNANANAEVRAGMSHPDPPQTSPPPQAWPPPTPAPASRAPAHRASAIPAATPTSAPTVVAPAAPADAAPASPPPGASRPPASPMPDPELPGLPPGS